MGMIHSWHGGSSCRGQVCLSKGSTYGNGDRVTRGSQSGYRFQIIINPKRRVDAFELNHGRQFRFAQVQPKYGRKKNKNIFGLFWSLQSYVIAESVR